MTKDECIENLVEELINAHIQMGYFCDDGELLEAALKLIGKELYNDLYIVTRCDCSTLPKHTDLFCCQCGKKLVS